MDLQAIALTEDSFKITGRGIILELQHSQKGLPPGTELISDKCGLTWVVKVRVLFDHAVHQQLIFESEATDFMLKNFKTDEKKQASIAGIKKRESNSIYQYLVEPIDHDEQPKSGEKLKIKFSQ